MKVKLYGFEVESEGVVTLNDLFMDFQINSGEPDTSRNIERRIYLDNESNPSYCLGLIVTVKDRKKFCRLENDKKGTKITVENLKGKEKMMEFNFFVINKNNGLGVYQHYHQSCGIIVFGNYLISRYNKLRKSKIDTEINDSNCEINKSRRKIINKKYKGKLKFFPLVRKESLDIILNEYKRVKAFEYEYSTLDIDKNIGVPLREYVIKKREKLTFGKNFSIKDLASGIIKTISAIKPEKGRVYVIDDFDEDSSVKIFDIPDNFGEEEYDAVAEKLHNLDIYSFSEHLVIGELINVCESDEYSYIFKAKLK